MSIKKVGAVIWTTTRLDAVLEFYRAIGIPLEPDTHEEPTATPHYEADVADTHFAVFAAKDAQPTNVPAAASTTIGIAVDDIEAVCKAMESLAARFRTPLEDTPWGRRIVVFDPDGRPVELYQPA